MSGLLDGKVVMVSTGTKGVGRALVERCCKEGARVVFTGRDAEAAERLRAQLAAGGHEARFAMADLTDVSQIAEAFELVRETYGLLDGFVHYAGITPVADLASTDERTYDLVMGTNLKAAFFSVKEALPLMRRGGSVVLIGSAHAWGGQRDRAAYAVSKGALLTLSDHIAKNYACDQVRSNVVTMGWTATDGELALRASQGMTASELDEEASAALPMGRMCTPDDVVPALVYLLSDQSRFVTGANIRCTGGEYI